MWKALYENSMYLFILYLSLLHLWYILGCKKNTLMKKYEKMTEEEKRMYDVSKVKMVQVLFIMWELILTIIAFIFDKICPDIVDHNIFLICIIISAVIATVLSEKWVLRVFCKKTV